MSLPHTSDRSLMLAQLGIWCSLLPLLSGLLIEPLSFRQGSEPHFFTFCDAGSKPLSLGDPFPDAEIGKPVFIAMSWMMDVPAKNIVEEELLTYIDEAKVKRDGVTLFQSWGMEINFLEQGDTVTFKAVLQTIEGKKELKITVASAKAPELSSPTLELSKVVQKNGSTLLSCGKIKYRGDPEIILHLKSDEKFLKSSYRDGNFTALVPAGQDSTQYTCELDANQSIAANCLSESAQQKWTGSVLSSSKETDGTNTAIIGAAVGFVVLIIIIIIIVVCLLKRKGGKAYSTKSEEAKLDAANGGDNADPLLMKDDQDRGGRSPIYTGTASPYAVTGIKLPMTDVGDGRQAPVATSEESRTPSGASSSGPQSPSEGPKPQARPRTVFLTASQEALDQVGRTEGRPGTQV